MVYIRAKKVGSDRYLYLVRSVWDRARGTSRQEIVKYLGRASAVTGDDLPEEYRGDARILASLATHSPADIKKREAAARRSRRRLYEGLTGGSIDECVRIYEANADLLGPGGFFERILRPVMGSIGDDWASGRLDVATEHVASNVAQALVRIIMDRSPGSGRKKRVLICVPQGEEHRLGCDVLETYLRIKGFRVHNMASPAPTGDILGYIERNSPDAVLVSITLPDNVGAGRRLVESIRGHSDVQVLVGGYAVREAGSGEFGGAAVGDVGLDEVPKLLRGARRR